MNDAVYAVKALMEGGHISFLLDELKKDIALSIIRTEFEQNAKREELYALTKAIDALDVKLQECVNTYDQIQESE
ncbi:UNVERIFIED_CONTAM: hypothetical protein RF648_18115 [Kocuria sp. CPCC 205274]